MDREDAYNSPISTGDAAAMLRRRPLTNDRPFIAETTKLNNRNVDEWKKTVLDEIADQRGSVPSGRVWHSWQLFDEGKGVIKYQELKRQGMIPEISEEVLEFWKDFFENLSVGEMHSYGSGAVSFGWEIIQNYMKRWYADRKYEALFSKFDSPLEWERNHHVHKPLLHGEILPFWDENTLKDIQHKVGAVLFNQVQPQQASGFQ